ncbi:PucR family transcriptional regulator [Leucobacter denitrificans]|uniref:Helix-turn-helix domain-containing protein n=1 Tax=Leucobacter denitrificans TaxID=683042 RepID=A0A7G9S2C6_9MICO|nr:helix-turn-helix domain-containing protein [Leucobacter denitrificans]QNN62001.1 helix-turn-helix domain-containing protein [Leucobacter denitrificans]
MAPSHTLSAVPAPHDAERWNALLNMLDVEQLTKDFLSVVERVPGYDPAPIPQAELVRTAILSFEALIAGLRAGMLDEEISIAHQVGVSRARAGVPLAALMTAIHNDFTVLWEALIAVSEPEDAKLIVRHTAIVLHTVDQYVRQTQEAYVDEQRRMDEEASSLRQGLIAELFRDPQPPAERLIAIAQVLSIPANARIDVVVALGDDIESLRVFVSESERAGARVYTHHSGDALLAFSHTPVPAGSRLEEVRTQLLAQRVGVNTATNIRTLRETANAARELARLLEPTETGAMDWTRGWARLANRSLLETGTPVISDVTTALDDAGPTERARLEEAVRSYLATGSISESAALLFCHRNTLANRLRRFAEITGVDPLLPTDAARLVVGWA